MGSVRLSEASRKAKAESEKRRREANKNRERISIPAEKFCGRCKRTLPGDGFHKSSRETDGLTNCCKQCNNARSRQRYASDPSHSLKLSSEYRRKQRLLKQQFIAGEASSPPKSLEWHIGQYGMSIESFCEMNERQDGRCLICRSKPDDAKGHRSNRLYIDHCHETGIVRGLLCSRCNSAIGYFDHRAELLLAAAAYLNGASHAETSNTEPVHRHVPVLREQHGDVTDVADSAVADDHAGQDED